MPNRLAESKSLYLRKHAENPIAWWPWIPEALTKAREEDLPIFLSIGYSSCHWCTVMEGEAFSDLAIAAYMNEHFLPIKVDREEQPDVDSIYMQSLQLMTGQGGWPLNAFLSPQDLIPFYAGTYFPVEPRYGRPGFLQILQRIHQFYTQEKIRLAEHKQQLLGALQSLSQTQPSTALGSQWFREGISRNLPLVSSVGVRQQFPMMPYAQLIQRASRFPDEEGKDALERVRQRGMDLVLGGIFDHVGGGFHRYTVDPTWTIPHFEKMLYDNGQILEFLADLWSQGIQDPAIERAMTLTVEWLSREMTAPEGYFYAAQDADSFASSSDLEPEEGEFYVWTLTELQAHLSPETLANLEKDFFIRSEGNFPDRPGYLVLQRLTGGDLSPGISDALQGSLFALRYGQPAEAVQRFSPARNAAEAKTTAWTGRIPPVTDTKMIVAWNSLMISGLARTYQVLGIPICLDMAEQAALFILRQQKQDGHFLRVNYDGSAAISAKAEDYALFIKALLDLHQASLGRSQPVCDWQQEAMMLQQEMDSLLWDPDKGGYFITDLDSSDHLLIREKDLQDNATPAANGVAYSNLIRLLALTGNLEYLDRAEQGLKSCADIIEKQTRSCPTLITALDWHHHFLKVVVLPEILPVLQKQYWPTTLLLVSDLDNPLPAGSVGLVCVGLKCLDPVDSLEKLTQQMHQSALRPQA